MDFQKELKDLKPDHDFFVGIDSDGCVFDTMEVKQKEFFIPDALKYFDLYAISEILRETWEFVNLYSVNRGGNRFTSIIKVFDLLSEREEIKLSGIRLPDMGSLKQWISTETKLSNANLRKYFESHYDSDLEKVVNWTESVNNNITQMLRNIPPFQWVELCLEKINHSADIVIVSQTPLEALVREWEEHGIRKFAAAIAGQEHGTKTEHIRFAAKGKYHDKRILMIGDAKGDLDAAKNNGILFFPVIPGREAESWKRFHEEGFEKFTNGTFSGSYQESLIREFNDLLPENPPWII
jgi:phosphoglycolate phosphatase-like HAD superfamily hydrolase